MSFFHIWSRSSSSSHRLASNKLFGHVWVSLCLPSGTSRVCLLPLLSLLRCQTRDCTPPTVLKQPLTERKTVLAGRQSASNWAATPTCGHWMGNCASRPKALVEPLHCDYDSHDYDDIIQGSNKIGPIRYLSACYLTVMVLLLPDDRLLFSSNSEQSV